MPLRSYRTLEEFRIETRNDFKPRCAGASNKRRRSITNHDRQVMLLVSEGLREPVKKRRAPYITPGRSSNEIVYSFWGGIQ